MFENRNRKKRKNGLLFFVALILVCAFGFGYYLNYDSGIDVTNDKTKQGSAAGFQIPDSIRNPGTGVLIPDADPNIDPNVDEDTSTIGNVGSYITPNTKINFKTYFTLCGHMVDKDLQDTNSLINLNENDLKNKFPDWTVSEFSPQKVILKREKQTYCPRHFIIGAKDEYIAIYVYNDDGIKTLYEMTEYPTSVLTTEDQKNLELGIVADNEEELQQKLEGLSD